MCVCVCVCVFVCVCVRLEGMSCRIFECILKMKNFYL